MTDVAAELLGAIAAERGHFRDEPGHHGGLWLDLDPLLAQPARVERWSQALAVSAAACRPEVVCGPLIGGAFVAQLVALALRARFAFTTRALGTDGTATYALAQHLRGQRVLLVDDAVNAGSALRATAAVLDRSGAVIVGSRRWWRRATAWP